VLTLFNNMNIRYKLISTYSLFAVLIGLFIFFFFPYQQRKQILSQTRANSLAISKMTADNLAASLEFGDQTTAQEVLNVLKENEDFVFVLVENLLVENVNGEPFAALNQERALQLDLLKNVDFPTCQIVDNIAVTTIPILSKGLKIGVLTIGLSISSIKAEINKNTTIAQLVVVLLVLITILTSMIIGKVISNPIHKVIEVSSTIAQGDFSNELKVVSRDEVGQLASAINEMSRKLKSSNW